MNRNLITINMVFGAIFFLSSTCIATPMTGFISEVIGKDMVGMNITVEYINNGITTSHTSLWQNLPSEYSGVSENWGTLRFEDDENTFKTSDGRWDLSVENNYSINSLTIDGGNTVFDIILGDWEESDYGTPGSELGYWGAGTKGDLDNPITSGTSTINDITFNWTFSDVVYLASTLPDDAIGDVYRTVRFDFEPHGPLTTSMLWQLDTDLAQPVPEPSTILLFGAGIAGLGYFHRRKKQKHH